VVEIQAHPSDTVKMKRSFNQQLPLSALKVQVAFDLHEGIKSSRPIEACRVIQESM
jgi:hypothetical protein